MGNLRFERPETTEAFAAMVKDVAPLPWTINGSYVTDANDNAILGAISTRPETVLNAVIVAVNTCGGFRFGRTEPK